MDLNSSSQFPNSPSDSISARRKARTRPNRRPEYALWIDDETGAVGLGDGNYRAASLHHGSTWEDQLPLD